MCLSRLAFFCAACCTKKQQFTLAHALEAIRAGVLHASKAGCVALQGSCSVDVETRTSSKAAFGQGTKKWMTFSQLLAELQQGSDLLYLSPQEVRSGQRPRQLQLLSAAHLQAGGMQGRAPRSVQQPDAASVC